MSASPRTPDRFRNPLSIANVCFSPTPDRIRNPPVHSQCLLLPDTRPNQCFMYPVPTLLARDRHVNSVFPLVWPSGKGACSCRVGDCTGVSRKFPRVLVCARHSHRACPGKAIRPSVCVCVCLSVSRVPRGQPQPFSERVRTKYLLNYYCYNIITHAMLFSFGSASIYGSDHLLLKPFAI